MIPLGVLCISLVMIVMANASLNVALPTLAESLPQMIGRKASPDSEQLRWILKGRSVSRIVVENPGYPDPFSSATAA